MNKNENDIRNEQPKIKATVRGYPHLSLPCLSYLYE